MNRLTVTDGELDETALGFKFHVNYRDGRSTSHTLGFIKHTDGSKPYITVNVNNPNADGLASVKRYMFMARIHYTETSNDVTLYMYTSEDVLKVFKFLTKYCNRANTAIKNCYFRINKDELDTFFAGETT